LVYPYFVFSGFTLFKMACIRSDPEGFFANNQREKSIPLALTARLKLLSFC